MTTTFHVSPLELIQSLGLKENESYKQTENSILLKTCPFCQDDEWHFYLYTNTNIWVCYKCSEGQNKGNLLTLRRHLEKEYGIQMYPESPSTIEDTPSPKIAQKALRLVEYQKLYETPLWEVEDNQALNWLRDVRKINDDTIKAFHLGYVKKFNRHYVTIPFFDNDGWVVFLRFRLASQEVGIHRLFSDKKINKVCLYNWHAIDKKAKEIYVTEGEIDAWTMYQMGYKNVVSLPNGAGSYKFLTPLKESTMKIYLLYDLDYVGKELAKSAIDFLGRGKVKQVKFDADGVKDANDVLQKHIEKSKEIIDKAVREAEHPTLIDVIGVEEAFFKRLTVLSCGTDLEGNKDGIDTPWENLNKVLPCYRYGNVTVVSGYSCHGKTFFTLQWVLHLLQKGIKTFFFCMEMNAFEQVDAMTKILQGDDKPIGDLAYTAMAAEKLREYKKDNERLPLWIVDRVQERTPEAILSLIQDVVERHEAKVVIFDNFHMMKVGKVEHSAQLYNHFSKDLKFLAEKHKIVLIVLAQLSKGDERLMPDFYKIRETSAICNDASSVLIIWRRRIDSGRGEGFENMGGVIPVRSNYTWVSVEKSRMEGKEAKILLKYDNGALFPIGNNNDDTTKEEVKAVLQARRW